MKIVRIGENYPCMMTSTFPAELREELCRFINTSLTIIYKRI